MTLGELFTTYGSDKESTHHYGALYERHLGHLRDRPAVKLLEIGVDRGASLKAWCHWLSSVFSEVYGLDIKDRRDLNLLDRIYVAKGDQSDPKILDQLVQVGPFDVIVDDGSHVASDVTASFRGLFDRGLRPGGLYVIEDLGTSYWKNYGGGPPGTPGTAVAMLKGLLDEMDSLPALPDGRPVNPGAGRLAAIHLYPNIAFIEKAGG